MLNEVKPPPHVPQVRRKAGESAALAGAAPLTRAERALRYVGIVGYSICGAVAVATPLLLWMTWSPEVYYLVLLAGFLACCGIVFLSKFLPEYRNEELRRRGKR